MTYATQQDLIDRCGESMLIALTDRAGVATGLIDAAVVTRALVDADAVIDGYLLGRYTLPLASSPPLVRDFALSIALYKLHTTTPDGKVEADYKDALAGLRDIAKGQIRLAVAGIEPATSGEGNVQVTDRERPLSAETMKGWI